MPTLNIHDPLRKDYLGDHHGVEITKVRALIPGDKGYDKNQSKTLVRLADGTEFAVLDHEIAE